jgi:putative component of toxin-antitoxin plasmid stabilization module
MWGRTLDHRFDEEVGMSMRAGETGFEVSAPGTGNGISEMRIYCGGGRRYQSALKLLCGASAGAV